MDNILFPKILFHQIVQLVIKNFEFYEKVMFENIVFELNEKLKLFPHSDYENKLALLKNEFQLRVKELRNYGKWKGYDRSDLKDLTEECILFILKNDPTTQKTLKQILNQKEKFVRAEFMVKPTSRMLEMAIYRESKTGKEKSYRELPLTIQNKLPDILPTGFAIYSDSLSTDIDIDSIIIYTDKSKTTKPILPEAEYLQLSVGNFTKPLAYRHALVSFIENLRIEIHKLELLAETENKKKSKSIKQEMQRKTKSQALNWFKKGDVDKPNFNDLKVGLENKGFIEKIHGNTFKSAFRSTIETDPEIDWIGKNAKSNMVYFLYLIWNKKLAKPATQRFTVIPNCFKLNGKLIEDKKLDSLRVRFNQMKNYAEKTETITQVWMKNMMEDMQYIVDKASNLRN
jgi:hypothetical protein